MNDKRELHSGRDNRNSPRSPKKDELGPNCEVGSKLRALYTSIQDETIPDRFLDLLEKLDQIEQQTNSCGAA